jgi:hypothetical protein
LRGAAYRDALAAWQIGQMVAQGFHQPQQYPDPPSLDASTTQGRIPEDVAAEIARIQLDVKMKMDAERARNGR